jgi:hypothetical protein
MIFIWTMDNDHGGQCHYCGGIFFFISCGRIVTGTFSANVIRRVLDMALEQAAM